MKTPLFWQSRGLVAVMLSPLSLLYALGAWIDRVLTLPRPAPAPVISVGNATAGGTGKTPLVLALVPLLRQLQHTPHILTRGYQGAGLNAHCVTAGDDFTRVGDEALLLAEAAPTWVGAGRLASAKAAAHAGASVLVCDDAHQHHALMKTVSLLVIDGPYGVGNGFVMPAGPLREPFGAALKRADAVVMIGEDVQHLAQQLTQPVFKARLVPRLDVQFLTQGKWLAFAGIGRPEKFFTSLQENGAALIKTRKFADHHAFDEKELVDLMAEANALGAQLITTEKDWVRMSENWRQRVAVLPMALQFDEPEQMLNFLKSHLAPHQPA